MSIWLFGMSINVVVHLLLFSIDPIVAATASNFDAQINSIFMLSGVNFKSWKESAEIVLGCIPGEEHLITTVGNSNATKIEK